MRSGSLPAIDFHYLITFKNRSVSMNVWTSRVQKTLVLSSGLNVLNTLREMLAEARTFSFRFLRSLAKSLSTASSSALALVS
jgi:hypothetical protein